jgi:branched-chain amino acid transport system ATP-binding protein
MTGLLEIGHLSVSFGSVEALNQVSLTVAQGQKVGLIGPNGAGKTTLLNAVSGFIRAKGAIMLAGQPLLHLSADKRARLGIGRTFQQPQIFAEQTVLEHLIVARDHARNRVVSPAEVASLVGIDEFLDVRARELPSHARVRLEVARATVGQPKLLLLDEPAAGLLSVEVAELNALLRRLSDAVGAAILVIDHNMELVLNLCDWVYVLDFGRLLFQGAANEVRSSPLVIDAYLGKE